MLERGLGIKDQRRDAGTVTQATEELEELAQMFADRPVALLTGAGISTDSGIPDYRGTGAPVRAPMSVQQFLADHHYRQRFWGGARVGTLRTRNIAPNEGHRATARMEAAGLLSGVITQNTDGLHALAGSRDIAELHGNGRVIRCIEHNHRWNLSEVLVWFDTANPGFADRNADAQITPDGDADVTDVEGVAVPVCPACGGMLRPNVVYFGEHVPYEVFTHAEEILDGASALLVAGTSLAVNTGVRLVNRAERRDMPIAVINKGPTAIDMRPSVEIRIEGGTSQWLTALATRLGA